ncbi:hypothetical protein CCACVL1_05154 [Corchorus capsularis]|uniref:Low-temperature-induced 65 kDa protein n=1 Tax=Corchorus capsularis TaxID=210143 RepID=A0A1R3JM97_COCAP|nr:hypothetical protein CCACVL1_05154 [Corchorus capsularis]
MDTQTAYHHGHNQEHDPNVVGHHHHEGEDDNDHHEKKSVLKKVKEKAKKIKNTIKKHGHGHDHDHGHEGHIPDDHDLDEEDDDEDEEDIVDPEVHGAPMYDSAAARSAVPVYQQPEALSRPGITHVHPDTPVPRDGHFYSGSEKTKFNNEPAVNPVTGIGALVTEQPKVNFGKQTAVYDDPLLAPQNTPVGVPRQTRDTDPSKTFVHGKEEYPAGQPKVNLQRPKGLEEDPAAPKDTPGAYTTNYQTKVTDPTGKGGEVTGITPILHSFDKMNIHGTQDTGLREQKFPPAGTHQRPSDLSFPTGSHDQFSPEPTAPSRITKTPENSPLVSETVDTSKLREEQLHSTESDKPSNQSSYTEKISSATSAIADKAVSAKNIVASKLGYGEKDSTPANESYEGQDNKTTKQSSSAMDYGKKIAGTVTGTLSPVYEKVAEAGSSVISKLHGPGTGTATEVGTDELQGQDKGVSMTGYISEKLKPGEEDKALSEFLTEAWNPQKEKTKPRGKVTESVEVTRRLGAADQGYERADSVSENSTSKGMVDKIKGTVGSWFGKTEEPQQQQQANVSSSDANEDYTSSTYERKLQESGN